MSSFFSFFKSGFLKISLSTGKHEVKNINIKNMETIDRGLYIISTPIGNLGDITLRAEKILKLVDFIVCENPYHSLKLLNKLGIKKKMFSLHDYNEENLIKKIEKFQTNSSIALISDAGSPLISDPGYGLVRDYIEKEIPITTIPGPSAVISAIQLSGLPNNNFVFKGFVSKNKQGIKNQIDEIRDSAISAVYFISGNKILVFLKYLIEKKIYRQICVCKEITKKNERVFRGLPQNILDEIEKNTNNTRGEFVIIIKGKDKGIKKIIDDVIQKQINTLLVKFSLTEVVEVVHKLTNISKKDIYKTALKIKND